MCIDWHMRSLTLRYALAMLLPAFLFAAGCGTVESDLPPGAPRIVRADDSSAVDADVNVTFVAEDPEGSPLDWEIEWGDDRAPEQIGGWDSGVYLVLLHRYSDPGTYRLRARVSDAAGHRSPWSDPLEIRIGGEAVVGRGDWWMFMRDAQHSGHSSFAGPLSPVIAWLHESGSPVRSSAAFDKRGTAHFGGNSFLLQAMYADGQQKWAYWTGGARISNTPALHHDGAVSFGSSSANMYRVNRHGIKEWNISVNAPIIRSSATLDQNGRMYIGSEDRSIYCVDRTGLSAWTFQTNGAVHASPALSLDERSLYVGSDDQVLYALSTDGELQWTYATEGAISGSATVGQDGSIYVGSADNMLYALRPDGSLRWKRDLHAPLYTTVAVTRENRIYAATFDGLLYCLDADGTVLWDQRFAAAGGLASPVVDVLGTAYIGSPDGQLSAIASDGRLLWRFDTEGPINATASISQQGGIFIANDKGRCLVLGDR